MSPNLTPDEMSQGKHAFRSLVTMVHNEKIVGKNIDKTIRKLTGIVSLEVIKTWMSNKAESEPEFFKEGHIFSQIKQRIEQNSGLIMGIFRRSVPITVHPHQQALFSGPKVYNLYKTNVMTPTPQSPNPNETPRQKKEREIEELQDIHRYLQIGLIDPQDLPLMLDPAKWNNQHILIQYPQEGVNLLRTLAARAMKENDPVVDQAILAIFKQKNSDKYPVILFQMPPQLGVFLSELATKNAELVIDILSQAQPPPNESSSLLGVTRNMPVLLPILAALAQKDQRALLKFLMHSERLFKNPKIEPLNKNVPVHVQGVKVIIDALLSPEQDQKDIIDRQKLAAAFMTILFPSNKKLQISQREHPEQLMKFLLVQDSTGKRMVDRLSIDLSLPFLEEIIFTTNSRTEKIINLDYGDYDETEYSEVDAYSSEFLSTICDKDNAGVQKMASASDETLIKIMTCLEKIQNKLKIRVPFERIFILNDERCPLLGRVSKLLQISKVENPYTVQFLVSMLRQLLSNNLVYKNSILNADESDASEIFQHLKNPENLKQAVPFLDFLAKNSPDHLVRLLKNPKGDCLLDVPENIRILTEVLLNFINNSSDNFLVVFPTLQKLLKLRVQDEELNPIIQFLTQLVASINITDATNQKVVNIYTSIICPELVDQPVDQPVDQNKSQLLDLLTNISGASPLLEALAEQNPGLLVKMLSHEGNDGLKHLQTALQEKSFLGILARSKPADLSELFVKMLSKNKDQNPIDGVKLLTKPYGYDNVQYIADVIPMLQVLAQKSPDSLRQLLSLQNWTSTGILSQLYMDSESSPSAINMRLRGSVVEALLPVFNVLIEKDPQLFVSIFTQGEAQKDLSWVAVKLLTTLTKDHDTVCNEIIFKKGSDGKGLLDNPKIVKGILQNLKGPPLKDPEKVGVFLRKVKLAGADLSLQLSEILPLLVAIAQANPPLALTLLSEIVPPPRPIEKIIPLLNVIVKSNNPDALLTFFTHENKADWGQLHNGRPIENIAPILGFLANKQKIDCLKEIFAPQPCGDSKLDPRSSILADCSYYDVRGGAAVIKPVLDFLLNQQPEFLLDLLLNKGYSIDRNVVIPANNEYFQEYMKRFPETVLNQLLTGDDFAKLNDSNKRVILEKWAQTTECQERVVKTPDLSKLYTSPNKWLPLLTPLAANTAYHEFIKEFLTKANAGSLKDKRYNLDYPNPGQWLPFLTQLATNEQCIQFILDLLLNPDYHRRLGISADNTNFMNYMNLIPNEVWLGCLKKDTLALLSNENQSLILTKLAQTTDNLKGVVQFLSGAQSKISTLKEWLPVLNLLVANENYHSFIIDFLNKPVSPTMSLFRQHPDQSAPILEKIANGTVCKEAAKKLLELQIIDSSKFSVEWSRSEVSFSSVKLPRNGMCLIPKFYILELAKILKPGQELKVTFNKEKGLDVGGLKRDFLNGIFESFCNSESCCSSTGIPNAPLKLPRTKSEDGKPTEEETELYKAIGIIIGYCYQSKITKRTDCREWDD